MDFSFLEPYMGILVGGVVSIISAFFGYLFGILHMRKESSELLQREYYSRKLDALRACYALLIFMTEAENEKSIITFEGNKGERKFYFSPSNIKLFINELPKQFYGKGMGIYLSKEIKQAMFEYRNIIYQLLHSPKTDGSDRVLLLNTQVRNRMYSLYESLIRALRKEINNYGSKK